MLTTIQHALDTWNASATAIDRGLITLYVAVTLGAVYAMALCVMAAIESRNRNR